VAFGLLVSGVPAPAGMAQTPGDAQASRIRIDDPRVRELAATGSSRSATFRRLLAELEAGDVIVQVTSGRPGDRLRGSLLHRVVVAGSIRYLFITIDPNGAANRLIGTLAHELQHAIEVLREPGVGRGIP